MFNVNDFDETLPGVDFTVDLKRLAASVAVAAHTAHIAKKPARALVAGTVAAYRKHMLSLAEVSPLEAWHSHISLEHQLADIGDKGLQRSLRALIDKARGKGLETDDNFPRLANADELKIADKPPVIFHVDPSTNATHLDATRAFSAYREVLPPDRF